MKKLVLFIIISILLFLIFVSPYLIDDFSCYTFKNKIENSISEANNISLIDIDYKCGNATGTGNHTDMYVCALIRTPIDEEQLELIFGDAINIVKADHGVLPTNTMLLLGIEFDEVIYYDDYYILEFVESAPCSEFDIRGH